MKLRIHDYLPFSLANGPGGRAVLWLQGCPLGCPGCCNPETHAYNQGRWIGLNEVMNHLVSPGRRIEGVTISGGEPLAQLAALTELLRRLRSQTNLSVILFTGYTWQEVQGILARRRRGTPGAKSLGRAEADHPASLLRYVDVLIAGRYDRRRRIARGLRGSANKTVHFLTRRYTPQDIESVPTAEIIINTDGRIVQSGIVPLNLQKHSRSTPRLL
jgi:anaerobic ribonucleoside-triphosphate reductase activating protein